MGLPFADGLDLDSLFEGIEKRRFDPPLAHDGAGSLLELVAGLADPEVLVACAVLDEEAAMLPTSPQHAIGVHAFGGGVVDAFFGFGLRQVKTSREGDLAPFVLGYLLCGQDDAGGAGIGGKDERSGGAGG